MKKLLSAILSATLAAGTVVTAMAIDTNEIDAENFNFANSIYVDEAEVTLGADVDSVNVKSGGTIFIPFIYQEEGQEAQDVTKLSELEDVRLYVKVTEGKDYVEKYEIAKENDVYGAKISLADYYGEDAVEIEGEISLKNRRTGREIVSTDDLENMPIFEIENNEEEVASRNGVAKYEINEDTQIVSFDEDTTDIAIDGDGFYYDVKASNQDPVYLGVSKKAMKEIAVAYEKADLTFFDFVGTPVFDFNGTLSVIVPDADVTYFLYEINEDGKLVASDAKFNEEDEVFELRTNTLGAYILSDKELDVEVHNGTIEDGDEDNTATETPDADKEVPTGALA